MHVIEKPPLKLDKEKGIYYEYHKSKKHNTGKCIVLKREVEEKQLTSNLIEVTKHLGSKFEVAHK